jgi:hypothetical protein
LGETELPELIFPSQGLFTSELGAKSLFYLSKMQFFRLKDKQYHSTKGLDSRKRDSKVIDGVAQTHEVG